MGSSSHYKLPPQPPRNEAGRFLIVILGDAELEVQEVQEDPDSVVADGLVSGLSVNYQMQ